MTTLAEVRAALDGVSRLSDDPTDWDIYRIHMGEETRKTLASLPADGVIVTLDSLARALRNVAAGQYVESPFGTLWHDLSPEGRAAAILAAIAAEDGPA